MDSPRFEIAARSRSRAQGLVFLAVMAAFFGLYYAPERAWPNLLLNGFYITSLAVSAIFFLATQRLAGARWSASLRRIPEAFMLAMPVAAALMLLLFFGRQTLYSWSHPGAFADAPAIAGKVRYLQIPWMFVRVIGALALWGTFAWLFRKASLEQDGNPRYSLLLHHRMTSYAAFFIPIFAVTFSLSVFDWLISLDSHWFSTMFAVYVFAGTFVQGIAAITLAAILLKERGSLAGSITEHQLHDLGKMLFAFSTFWAYIWTCQYLLIWYGNIPEETTWDGGAAKCNTRRRSCESTRKMKSRRKVAVGTTKKSVETRSSMGFLRNVFQVCEDGLRGRTMYLATVVSATRMPSFRSSP